MHHVVIGEGQIGRALIAAALVRGDTVTVVRRTPVRQAEERRRYGQQAQRLSRVQADAADPAVMTRAVRDADAVHMCMHARYDARVWRRVLPLREHVVLDAAWAVDAPVVFPESMYAFAGQAADVHEGASLCPVEDKGRVRGSLLTARRDHRARTVSVVAADLIGPTAVGTGAAVVCETVIEPIAADRRAIVPADLSRPHALTDVEDLARAMLACADHADRLTGQNGDAVVHAPTDVAVPLNEVVDLAAAHCGTSPRAHSVPRFVLRMAGAASRTFAELSAISDMWYQPCRLHNGVLTEQFGLSPTPLRRAVEKTADAAMAA